MASGARAVKAAGVWDADYGRIYKNDDGDEAVCVGFSRGQRGSTIVLQLRAAPHTRFEATFVWCNMHKHGDSPWMPEPQPHSAGTDWYAVELQILGPPGQVQMLDAPFRAASEYVNR